MVRSAAWAVGLVAVMSLRAFAEPVPAAAGTGDYDQRLAAMEQELEELKLGMAEEAGKSKAPGTFRAFWDKGLKFATADGDFKMAIGGRVQYDLGWISQDEDSRKAFGDLPDGTEFRRLRLEATGDIYRNGFFKIQMDFAGGSANLKDAYVGIKGVPLFGSLVAGHMYEPFCLDTQTSSKYIEFMERSLIHEAFSPDRQDGIAFFNTALNDRLYYKAGLFRTSDDFGVLQSDAGYSMTGRVVGVPWNEDGGARFAHVGLSGSHRGMKDGNTLQYRTRPEWHLSTKRFVDTGAMKNVDSADLLGLEGSLVLGPFALQGEYIAAMTTAGAGGEDHTFDGFYVQGSYWLTGEHRNFKIAEGVYDRVTPKKNFGKDGWGAWEAAVRYSTISLNDGSGTPAVKGGEESNLTFGLNWHLNPNMRVMFNYTKSDLKNPDKGSSDMIGVRFQADF